MKENRNSHSPIPNRQETSVTSYEVIRQNYQDANKVIVAGGRDFTDYAHMCTVLDDLFFVHNTGFEVAPKIISGMAKGADTLAIRYSNERGLTKILFPANWKVYRRRAGFLRNEDMLSIATHLVAFWDGKSHGTQHMIEIAKKKGIPVWIINYNN